MENNIPIKYYIYARKSTEAEDKQVLSIDSQINEIKETAKKNNLKVVAVKKEAHSAKAPGRPIFNEIMKDIETGKVQGLIVWHPNRLSRNSVDTGQLVYLLDMEKLAEVRTPSQTFHNTPNDKFLLNLFCSQAKLENDSKGVDVKRGLKAKAEKGWLPSGAKPGYMNDPYTERGNKTIKQDPVRFPIVKEMWKLMLTNGYNPPQVIDIANEKLGYRTPKKKKLGGKPMSYSQGYLMFRDPFYYGMFEFPKGSGNWYRGRHKTMITQEEFDKVQEMLGGTEKPRPRKHVFPFTGMIRCGECGCMITAEHKTKRQVNGTVHYYTYYHCTKRKREHHKCSQSVIQAKDLEAQIIKTLDSLEIPQDLHEFGMKWMKKENKKQSGNVESILANLQKEYKECVATIDGIIDMRARKEINEQDYKRRMADAQKEKSRLEELLNDTGDQVNKWIETANEAFEFVEHAKEKFKLGAWEKKKEILATLGSNLILKDKILTIDLENCLIPMKSVSLASKAISKRFEPQKNALTKQKIERSYARSSTMLPSPSFMQTLEDWMYIASLKEKMNLIKATRREYALKP